MGLKNIFGKFKKNDTVIDLGDLQKRGIIKQRTKVREPLASERVVDLTGNPDSGGALGFLGSLAGASNESSSSLSEINTANETSSFGFERKQRLRGILRDMKTEMKNTSNKIYKIANRLDLLERKIERLERRAGV